MVPLAKQLIGEWIIVLSFPIIDAVEIVPFQSGQTWQRIKKLRGPFPILAFFSENSIAKEENMAANYTCQRINRFRELMKQSTAFSSARCSPLPHLLQMQKTETISSFSALIFLISLSLTLITDARLLPIVDEHGENATWVQTYIVHVLKPEGEEFLGADEDLEKWHKSFLPNTSLDSGEPRLIYSYREAISGFAARLTVEEVRAMEKMDGFLRADPEKTLQPLTTYTHELLNLSTLFGVWDTSNSFHGEGIIIGVLDTGIHRTHPSFSDTGMPPRPPRTVWNAKCYFQRPACNNKIIGAQAFNSGQKTSPPDDTEGHGSHVAGIAAGNFVDNAEVLGQASGRAAGTAPKAYISVYKVCWPQWGCPQADILAGIEQAMKDGVHILQLSIGAQPPYLPTSLVGDEIALATFSALNKGIFPCVAAGNNGPGASTLSHAAPWDMVVGASSVDRRIKVTITLGDANMTEIQGETAYQPSSFTNRFLPLKYPGMNGGNDATFCLARALGNVRNKIVVCKPGNITNIEKGDGVRAAGGAAMIIINWQPQGFTTSSEPHHLPAAHVSYQDGRTIEDYIFASSTPTAKFTFGGTVYGARPSPALAYFSSRGPSNYNGNVLKPDVIAPGVNILSAWPFEVGPNPTGLKRKTFNFLSGTSMATPHVSGIVALMMSKLKNDKKRIWSIPEMQSALITTANWFDPDGKPIFDEATFNQSANILKRGAGQVNASRAMDPGLVYDIAPADYVAYLCGIFANRSSQVSLFTKNSTRCTRSIPGEQLNYPSIGLVLGSRSATVNVTRTVTNVGDAREVYWADIEEPRRVKMDLSDYALSFSRVDQQITYQIRFSVKGTYPGKNAFFQGRLSWVSDKHNVTSPIYVLF